MVSTGITDQSRVLKLVGYEQARQMISNSVDMIRWEEVPSQRALYRVLAEDIMVAKDSPPFDRAAMDGYSLASHTTKLATPNTPLSYEVVGELFPNDQNAKHEIEPRQAVYVACGAPIPIGADCVVKVELVKRRDRVMQVSFPINSGKNVSRRGEDFKAGARLFTSNHLLRPQDIGALLAIGRDRVRVLSKPVAGVLAVGDELAEAANPRKRSFLNDHAHVVLGFLREFGAEPLNLGVCHDDQEEIIMALESGLRQCDLVITMGGASVGKKDLVPNAIMGLNAKILFHGLRVSPGKVTGLAMVKGKPIVMLAGHIITAVAGFFIIVIHLLHRMLNLSDGVSLGSIYARLSKDVKTKLGMARFLLAKIEMSDGQLTAMPFGFEASLLSNLVAANGYTILPENSNLKAGDNVRFSPLNHHYFG